MSSILSAPISTDVCQPALRAIGCVKVLQVFQLMVTDLGSGFDEIVLGAGGPESAAGDVDGAVVTVVLLLATAVVGFELWVS